LAAAAAPPPPLAGAALVSAAAAAAAAPAIRFHHVNFRYKPDRPVLHDVSFDVRRGETVAVVGPSGCGKSTLVRLLFRFFDVDEAGAAASGAAQRPGVYVHGQDVRGVTLESLRGALGVVPQDTTLFNDSIEANIAFGSAGARAGRAAVERAARAARIHDAIAHFPEGYATVVGERGLKLSGGEKQRVAIARAILKGAPILCCDEATSALDSATEAAIMLSLREIAAAGGGGGGAAAGEAASAAAAADEASAAAPARRPLTTLIIAHRLSTVMHADCIVVLERGRVAEKGTHAELMARGGLYATMWAQQQQKQREEEGGRASAGANGGGSGGGDGSGSGSGNSVGEAAARSGVNG
jgi:ATP-binding cassette subfamily B protein